jgi:hypothetical protein
VPLFHIIRVSVKTQCGVLVPRPHPTWRRYAENPI